MLITNNLLLLSCHKHPLSHRLPAQLVTRDHQSERHKPSARHHHQFQQQKTFSTASTSESQRQEAFSTPSSGFLQGASASRVSCPTSSHEPSRSNISALEREEGTAGATPVASRDERRTLMEDDTSMRGVQCTHARLRMHAFPYDFFSPCSRSRQPFAEMLAAEVSKPHTGVWYKPFQ